MHPTVDGYRQKGQCMKKALVPKNEFGMFADSKGVAKVDSLTVAEAFSKDHRNVIRDIRNLDCSEEFRLLNFEQSSYTNLQGKKQPCYNLTRDGFVFLVMGYRGKKAAAFKEAYIRRFNEMEEFIKYLLEARMDYPLLTANIQLIKENPKPYHFSNECNMLNRIVLGKTAKEVREEHGLKKGSSIRPYLTNEEIEAIDQLQRVDIGLLISTPDFQQRKQYLEWYYMKKFQ
jgi:Rha family phage regulatory protein